LFLYFPDPRNPAAFFVSLFPRLGYSHNKMVEELIQKIKGTEDLYEILGVAKEADEKDITKAYRKLALKLHPDKCTLEGGEDAFKKVGNACAVLKDPDQRAHYDRFGSVDGSGGGGGGGGNPFGHQHGAFNPDDLFREIFRNHPDFAQFNTGGHGGPQRRGMGTNVGRHGGGSPFGNGLRFGGGGNPFGGGSGGIHFVNLNGGGNPFGGNSGGGGGVNMAEALKIPEPLATLVKVVGKVVPVPVIAVGMFVFFSYTFTWVMALLLRNTPIVFLLMSVGSRTPFSSYLWLGFFGAGLLGVI
jgi:curved DNA-binding protein CbpA